MAKIAGMINQRGGKITARWMIPGLVLKYLNGECFVICGFYKYSLLALTEFNLTVPNQVWSDSAFPTTPDDVVRVTLTTS